MKISEFEKLGFSRKEAQVYITCLEIGSGTAFQIAKKLSIPKSTAHDILNNLVSRGYVSTYNKKNKKYFAASDPEVLGSKAVEQVEVFKRILPELKAMAYSGVGKPRVRYFDTKAGIEVAIKEMFAEAKDLIFYGNADAAWEAYPEYFPKYTKARVKSEIITRGMAVDGKVARELRDDDPKSLRRTKIITPQRNVTSLAWMWDDKFVIFNTTGDHSVLIVEDKRFAVLLKSMFEIVWNSFPE